MDCTTPSKKYNEVMDGVVPDPESASRSSKPPVFVSILAVAAFVISLALVGAMIFVGMETTSNTDDISSLKDQIGGGGVGTSSGTTSDKSYDGAIGSLEASVSDTTTEVAGLVSAVSTLQQQVAAMSGMSAQVAALQAEVASLRADLSALSPGASSPPSELAALTSRVQALAAALDAAGTSGSVVLISSANQEGFTPSGSLFQGSGYWASKSEAQLPSIRSDFPAVANPTNGTVFLLGGLDGEGNILDTLLEYDPFTHEYKTLANMPSPRFRFGAALLGSKLYVAGGFRSFVEADEQAKATQTTDVYDIATNTWTQDVATTVHPHGDTCMAAAGGKLYLLGGYGEFYSTSDKVEEMDPATNTWSEVASMSTPRGDVHCASVGGKVYAVGGFYDATGNFAPDSFLNTVEVYTPGTNSWAAVSPMPTARGDMAVAVLDENRFMVIGGETHARGLRTEVPIHDVEVYSADTDTWVEKAPMPTARFRFAATQVGGEVFTFGGHAVCLTEFTDTGSVSSCPGRGYDSVEVFFDTARLDVFTHVKDDSDRPIVNSALSGDAALQNLKQVVKFAESSTSAVYLSTSASSPEGFTPSGSLFQGSGYWASKSEAQLPSIRSDFPAVANPTNGTVFLLGGLDGEGNILDTLLEYDPFTHEYKTLANMPSPRFRFGAALLGSKLYVAGGFRSFVEADEQAKATQTTDVYDIATNTWTQDVATTVHPHGDTCMAAAGGKLYLLGGYGEFYSTSDKVEEMDPATNTWSEVASMSTPRGDVHCASVGGKVYAVGGFYDATGNFAPDSFLNTVEVYTPGTNSWAAVSPMPTARGDMAVAVLDENRFMVIGGETHARGLRTEVPIHDVEVYSADTDTWVEKAPMPTARFRFAATQVGGEVFTFGGHAVCLTEFTDTGSVSSCPGRGYDSVEVFFDTAHPTVFQHVAGSNVNVNDALTGDDLVSNLGDVVSFIENRPSPDVFISTDSSPPAGFQFMSNFNKGSGYWASKSEAQLPSIRSDFPAVANPTNGTVFLLGGLDGEGNILDTLLEYDPFTHEYKTLANMPSPRFRFGAALLGSKLYVAGGFRSFVEADEQAKATQTTDVYDIATNTWTQDVATTVHPHGDTCMAAAGGKLYLLGGYGEFYSTSDKVEEMDPATNTWSEVASMSTPRGDVHCASVGGKVYAVGGFYDATGNFAPDSFLNTVEVYTPGTNSWAAVSPMPTARGDMAVAVLDENRFMVIGGETHARGLRTEVPIHDVEVYSADTDTWVEKAPMPTARFRFAATQVGGEVFTFGGHAVCLTEFTDTGSVSSCPGRGYDSVEVFFDVDAADLYVHGRL